LPSTKHSGGVRYHGPQSGIVIQFLRCRTEDEIIKNGCISIGISDSKDMQTEHMRKFVQQVWKEINRFCVKGLVSVYPGSNEIISKKIPKFKLGPNAAEWCRKNVSRYFRDSTVYNYYRVCC
jgi:hypothetical protein